MNLIYFTSAAAFSLPVVCVYEPPPTSLEWILDGQKLDEGDAFVMNPKNWRQIQKALDLKTGKKYRKVTHVET